MVMDDMFDYRCDSLPVISAFLIGVYGKNILLIIVSIILGIGHIGIHLNHKRKRILTYECEL